MRDNRALSFNQIANFGGAVWRAQACQRLARKLKMQMRGFWRESIRRLFVGYMARYHSSALFERLVLLV